MRVLVALFVGLIAGIGVLTGLAGISGSWVFGALAGAAATVAMAARLRRRPIVALEEAPAPRALRIVSGAATILALVQLARLSVFMIDPDQRASSYLPGSDWEVRHSCVTAYFVAARAADASTSIYDSSLYNDPQDDPTRPRKARKLGVFNVDVYEYPPPFLSLPRALSLVAPDFVRFRMTWFGMIVLVLLVTTLAVARSLAAAEGTRALLLAPLLWAALPTLSMLQKGNFQAMAFALPMLAMLFFARQKWALGGAFLAYATVSKLFPGILVLYLLVQRRWRAVGWTAAFGVAFSVVTLLDAGPSQYFAFVDHLPGLLGGEAFAAFRNPPAMAANFSVPGLVFKLKLFGVAGMGFPAAHLVGWVYTLVVVAVTIAVARRAARDGGRSDEPLVWLAILILAAMRSPFLPQAYAAVPPIWLLTLLGARVAPTVKTLTFVVVAWLGLNVVWPVDWPMDPRLLAILNLVPQGLTLAVAVLALRPGVSCGGGSSPS